MVAYLAPLPFYVLRPTSYSQAISNFPHASYIVQFDIQIYEVSTSCRVDITFERLYITILRSIQSLLFTISPLKRYPAAVGRERSA